MVKRRAFILLTWRQLVVFFRLNRMDGKAGKVIMEDGFYVVEANGKRTVAERIGSEWLQCGIDYDVWQYSKPQTEVRILCYIQLGEKDDLIVIKPVWFLPNGE